MSTLPLVAGVDRAPALVVLGAPRCGTTSLAKYLDDGGMNVGIKDSFYLMDSDAGLRGPTHLESHGVPGYLDLFEESVSPTVEVAAGYLFQITALDFFSQWATPPRFVVIARNPVERLQSVYRYFYGNLGVLPDGCTFDHYVDDLKHGRVSAPDRTVSDALEQGNYAKWIDRWADVFGQEAVNVVSFDDLSTTPEVVVRNLIADAGGAPSPLLSGYSFEPRNGSYVPRSKYIAKATSLARRIAPTGAVRAWAGEQLRRWQSQSSDAPGPQLLSGHSSMSWLADYYEPANRDLSDRHGVDVSGWTCP